MKNVHISCSDCNKSFKTYQSMWIHKKRKHKSDEAEINNEYKCQYCEKTYVRNFTLKRHLGTCKYKNKVDNMEYKIIQEKINSNPTLLSKIIENNNVSDIYKISTKVKNTPVNYYNIENNKNYTQNNQQTLNNSHNNSHNNNYNINILSLGNENLPELLSNNEQLKILNQRRNSLIYLVEHAHLNDKYPQLQTILLKELKSNKIQVYDTNTQKFTMHRKGDIWDLLIENRINDIEDFYSKQETKLNPLTKDIISDLINEICDEFENPKSQVIKDIKDNLEIKFYNNKEKVINTHQIIRTSKLIKPKLKLKTLH